MQSTWNPNICFNDVRIEHGCHGDRDDYHAKHGKHVLAQAHGDDPRVRRDDDRDGVHHDVHCNDGCHHGDADRHDGYDDPRELAHGDVLAL